MCGLCVCGEREREIKGRRREGRRREKGGGEKENGESAARTSTATFRGLNIPYASTRNGVLGPAAGAAIDAIVAAAAKPAAPSHRHPKA